MVGVKATESAGGTIVAGGHAAMTAAARKAPGEAVEARAREAPAAGGCAAAAASCRSDENGKSGTDPKPGHTSPGAQAVQLPAAPREPAPQPTQKRLAAAAADSKRRGGGQARGVQSARENGVAWVAGCMPTGQVMATAMHWEASAAPGESVVVPVAQGVQLRGEVAPAVGEKEPSGHSAHACAPAAAHDPAKQDVHEGAPAGAEVPAGHAAQEAAVVAPTSGEAVPASQEVHCTEPT